jgi:hypothetical protein
MGPQHELLVLREELANYLAFFFIFDAREKFCTQRLDGLWSIKWHALINLTATKVTGLASRFKYGPNLGSEVDFGR